MATDPIYQQNLINLKRVQSGQPPLPEAPSVPQTNAALPNLSLSTAPENPMSIFSKGLFDMLTKAQGMDSAKLLNERNRLAKLQTTQSMGVASDLGIEGLAPGDALRARSNVAGLYNPKIENLTDRIQASAQAVSRFADTIRAAKEFGEDYVKYIKPTDDDINAVVSQMEAGFIPSEEVLEKVGKFLPNDIWQKASTAKKAADQPAGVQEYEYAKSQGFKGTYQQWVDRVSQWAPKSGGDLKLTPSPGFFSADIEADVREDANGYLVDDSSPEETYTNLRRLYSSQEVSDEALRNLVGLASQTAGPRLPGEIPEENAPTSRRERQSANSKPGLIGPPAPQPNIIESVKSIYDQSLLPGLFKR